MSLGREAKQRRPRTPTPDSTVYEIRSLCHVDTIRAERVAMVVEWRENCLRGWTEGTD
jgi:hypothetical protein